MFGCKFQVKDVPLEVSGLKPNLIDDFERGEPGSDPVSHDLLRQFVHSQGLIYSFLKVYELFFQNQKMGGFNDVGDGLWFIPQHEVEWDLLVVEWGL